MMTYRVQLTPIPLLSDFVTKGGLASKITSQTFDRPASRKELSIESTCHCLKSKHIPVRTVLLTKNITKNNVHN